MDVALALGGSVLSALLQVIFDRMAKPEFLNLFRKHKYDDSVLKKLHRKLRILRAVLQDAENKQTKSEAVKEWAEQLQEVLYEADDLIDQINTEALRVEVESQYPSSATNQVSASTNPSNFSIELLKEIMPKLEEIFHKLDEFEQEIGILGLVKEAEPKKVQFRCPSTSLVENDECGRDDEKNKIIQYLLSNNGNSEIVNVISIIGVGGIGKTTLAKLVYNDESVNGQFDAKAWVCISEEYDAIRITKSILNELGISCSDPNETFNSLQLKLKECLSKKKFLLVLDDIWNRSYEDWLALSTPFQGGEHGSKIIVTTRDKNIALMMGKDTQHIHCLNPMLEVYCWSLFKKHALSNRHDIGNSEFELIGKEIMKKCGGLPLAVKAVAGMLRSKETIEEWNEILRSDEWDTSNNQVGILPSLRLSYTHLSSHLKRCFSYCAVFHKDYQFSKNEVISLWMANDLLESPRRRKRLEDVGDEFFRELGLRSLFQQSSDERFSMHDLVNDLAKSVSGKHFLRLEKNWQQNGYFTVPRHFSYITDQYDIFEKFKPLNQSKILRTFLPIDFNWKAGRLSKKFLLDILPMFTSLRVLSLSHYSITELPNSLSNLKQLRFMNLSNTRIQMLPSWICTFYNLQTLLLVNCWYLEDFPEDMEKLISLRHLDISGTTLTKPLEIGRLKNIQILSTFIVSKENGSRIEELGKLCNLQGKFTISRLENIVSGRNASMGKMEDKQYIEELTLLWKGNAEDSQVELDVLENLRPHANIKHIKIQGYCGTRFPDWMQNSSYFHITNLYIADCKNCFCLPAIWQFPFLKHLFIRNLSRVVEIGQATGGNNCLEELCIDNCPELIGKIPKQLPLLKKLSICGCPRLVNSKGELVIFYSEGDFSSLAKLCIEGMPNMKELSSSKLDFNKFLPCLEELRITNCENLKLEGCGLTQICRASIEGLNIKNLSLSFFPLLQHLFIGSTRNMKELSIAQGNKNLTSLQFLEIHACDNFVSFPIGGLPAPNLTRISLQHCPKLKSLPEMMHTLLPSLQSLSIGDCPKMKCFPEGGLPNSLQSLYIINCERLWSCYGEWGSQSLPSLTKFVLYDDREQETWPPEDLLLPPTLTSLFLGGKSMKTLELQYLTCLQSLEISGCPKLQSLTEEGLPASLSQLTISRCPKLQYLLEMGLPASLSHLLISHCHMLQSLPGERLPASLSHMSISHCSMLQSLPGERLPASLIELTVDRCPLLKQRLEWEKGEDWTKVAHIPRIVVDEELIP